MQAQTDLTVYYDGTCPICSWEIGLYERMRGAERIDWRNIALASDAELGPGLDRAEALGKFHVRDADGRLRSGGQAFVEIWSRLTALRWAARLGRTSVGRRVLERAYRLFLRVLPTLRRWLGTRSRASSSASGK